MSSSTLDRVVTTWLLLLKALVTCGEGAFNFSPGPLRVKRYSACFWSYIKIKGIQRPSLEGISGQILQTRSVLPSKEMTGGFCPSYPKDLCCFPVRLFRIEPTFYLFVDH